MRVWGIHKKHKSLSWWENFMGGFLIIGPITIYGANAMRWTIHIQTRRWGVICFTLPVAARWMRRRDGSHFWHWYFYISPNGTPQAATFYRGYDENEKIRAQIRKMNFGHVFDSNALRSELYALNHKFSWFRLNPYDIETFGDEPEQ